jgi:hypothetical protein
LYARSEKFELGRDRILAMCIAPRYYGGHRKPAFVIVNNAEWRE